MYSSEWLLVVVQSSLQTIRGEIELVTNVLHLQLCVLLNKSREDVMHWTENRRRKIVSA